MTEECICSEYGDIALITKAIENADGRFTSWMEEGQILCKRCQRRRIATSFSILNAIRDSCRPFLETEAKREAPPPVVYEDAFPALSGGTAPKQTTTTLVPRKKNTAQPAAKAKRRIRPAVVTTVSTGKSSAWGSKGNLVDIPSQDPFPPPQVARAPVEKPPFPTTTTPTKAKRPPSSPPRQEAAEEFTKDIALLQLVKVYCILLNGLLVPSSALEFHLLFRLLKIPSTITARPTSQEPFSSILSSRDRCIYLADKVLQSQTRRLKGLGPPLWKELSQCADIAPELASQCEEWLHQVKLHPVATHKQTPHLTLPFEPQRDSRHNYRTSQEQSLYKNRELSRDAFLYQLRAFLSIRGKVVNAAKVNKAIDRVKQSSRTVLEGVLDGNVAWFCEFFCDLLLQIGLVPLEETDTELLNIADKDKLQKLHRRFSAKPSSSSAHSRKVVVDPQRSSSNSPKEEAQLLFPGHQEFFYIFLISADSYVFGLHLRNHLVTRMDRISSDVTRDRMEKCLLELRMLARFLGVLFLSPNWRANGVVCTASSTNPTPAMDGFHQMKSAGLDVLLCVERAASERNLVLVVPWVAELLRMTIWDPVSRESPFYWDILILLRRLQGDFANSKNMQQAFVFACIEYLFGDVVGLVETCRLSPYGKLIPKGSESGLDDLQDVSLSPHTVFSCLPHAEELVSLVSNLARPQYSAVRSPGISRKLRPSFLDTGYSPVTNKSSLPETQSKSTFQVKLRDSFYHQHAELKDICDFVIAQVLRKCSFTNFERQAQESFAKRIAEDGTSNVSDHCRELLRNEIDKTTRNALENLASREYDDSVIQVATSLAVDLGLERGAPLLHRLSAIDGWRSKEPTTKQLFSDESDIESLGVSKTPPLEAHIEKCVNALTALSDSISRKESDLELILARLHDVSCQLDCLPVHRSTEIPPEAALRPLFELVCLVDCGSGQLLNQVLSQETGTNRLQLQWRVLELHCTVAFQIQKWSRHGLKSFKARLDSPQTVLDSLRLGLRANVEPSQIAAVLANLMQSRILRTSTVSCLFAENSDLRGLDGVKNQLARKVPFRF